MLQKRGTQAALRDEREYLFLDLNSNFCFRNFGLLDVHCYLAVESVLSSMVSRSSNALNKAQFYLQYSSTFHTPLKRPILAKKGMILESSHFSNVLAIFGFVLAFSKLNQILDLFESIELDLVPHLGSE